VAGLITVAPLTLPRFVLLATFTRAVPDDTGGAAGPPWTIGGDTAPGPCSAGNGCAPGKFLGEGETTGWPIALRAVGAVIGVRPAGLRDEIPGFVVFALGLIRICCCVTPRGGSTGGATAASASIGTLALLGAGFVPLAPVPLAPFPLAPLLAVLARTACAWPSLARHGCAAKAASTMLERTSRKRMSFVKLTYALGCGGMSTGATGPAPFLRSRNNVISAGTTTSRTIGPINMPPTTTVASGRCT
jgi:hypothetical protein